MRGADKAEFTSAARSAADCLYHCHYDWVCESFCDFMS